MSKKNEAAQVTDPRPAAQIEAEEGARDAEQAPSQRGAERASADMYAAAGIWGAPGSEVPEDAETPPVAAGVRPASQVEAEDGAPDEPAAEPAEPAAEGA